MVQHGKSDSEVTSVAESSPARSPRRPLYYVQSPSRDSHDGEKTATSLQSSSTPILLTPSASPPHTAAYSSSSLLLAHSRDSSASRFSGPRPTKPHRPSSSSSSSAPPPPRHHPPSHNKPWSTFDMIEEEGLLHDSSSSSSSSSFPRRCYLPAFICGFFLLFSLFSLILWAASRPQKPLISLTSISFTQFSIQAGSDFSGVPTEMLSLNSTLRLRFRNRGTFFGVHVTATPVDLSYFQLSLGSGEMGSFYQPRRSQRSVSVRVSGKRIPLYGGGADWSTSSSSSSSSPSSSGGGTPSVIPLKLRLTVMAKAFVLGKLVKHRFYRRIECSVNLHTASIGSPISLRNSCSYS